LALLGRIVVTIFAVIVASFAAGMAIALGLLSPQWHVVTGDPAERFIFWGTAFFGATATGAIGLLPLVIAIALGESLKIRSLLANTLAGVAMMVLGYYGSGLAQPSYQESIDHPPPPISRAAEIAAAAGAMFGFVYWTIAGRNAGRWRESTHAL
jgi:hypothetical protein